MTAGQNAYLLNKFVQGLNNNSESTAQATSEHFGPQLFQCCSERGKNKEDGLGKKHEKISFVSFRGKKCNFQILKML